ncbi:essential MCU regulator, mitochondrial isoform X1 [Takifugu rubripes]|uniref:essential MCU regulator, mitochondrial isoform X1 n=1 Tax=Takifugu rubripes TaxID=31033 RepID=UPI000E6ECA49|nr:essential MCU regulator, mitochondrial-like isoform X1 [Takifugu rubripes]
MSWGHESSRSRSHPKGRPETDPYSGKMATTALRLPLRLSAAKLCVRAPKPGARAANTPRWTQNRTVVSTPSGAILPKPDKTPFGLIRMTVVVVPFLYVGTLISKNFAALLEEHDIFVPEDDDDDD